MLNFDKLILIASFIVPAQLERACRLHQFGQSSYILQISRMVNGLKYEIQPPLLVFCNHLNNTKVEKMLREIYYDE